MVLGIEKILKLVEEKQLLVGLSEHALKHAEGTGFDLRLGELYRLKSGGYLAARGESRLSVSHGQ